MNNVAAPSANDAPLRAALIQLSVGDDPVLNLDRTLAFMDAAAAAGADLVLTPECTNLMSPDRAYQAQILHPESTDPTLAALRDWAKRHKIWVLIGSLSLKSDDPAETRFANRGFLIGPMGQIVARYDKIHMFDVSISADETYRESSAYRPGDRAVLAAGPVPMGMTICYDLRFPDLYRQLAKAGAMILTVPAAFNPTTGLAHWQVLLQARAIETGCFVLAPAQCGSHATSTSDTIRRSYGHSMAIAPWGEVLCDMGDDPGFALIALDLGAVDRARARVPSLGHDRPFAAPTSR